MMSARRWSHDGISLISSGVGKPIPPSRTKPLPHSLGPVKSRVLVDLQRPLPPTVAVRDDAGNTIKVGIECPILPPHFSGCSHFGHQVHRIPHPSSLAAVNSAPLPSAPLPLSQSAVSSTSSPSAPPPLSKSPKSGVSLLSTTANHQATATTAAVPSTSSKAAATISSPLIGPAASSGSAPSSATSPPRSSPSPPSAGLSADSGHRQIPIPGSFSFVTLLLHQEQQNSPTSDSDFAVHNKTPSKIIDKVKALT